MAFGGRKAMFRVAAGLCGLALAISVTPAPARAQGFFERIFDNVRHAVDAPRPPNAIPFVDPFTSLANALNPPPIRSSEGGPARAFCVRTCDGRYFPVQAHAGMSAAESCRAFCPASATRLYAGGNIDSATAGDGSRYASSDNAFVYRKQLVSGCTCNGRDAFGLAHIDAGNDPTLRPGDIVATKSGLVAFTGSRNNVADFTPVENYARLSKSTREKLSDVKIMPPAPAAPEVTSSIAPAANARADARRDQFAR
jgi:hypothetical protein